MQYETIILELLSRIKILEDEVRLLKQQVGNISARIEDENEEDLVDNEGSGNVKHLSISYKKMTDEMIRTCYEYGKKVSEGKNAQEMADAIETLCDEYEQKEWLRIYFSGKNLIVYL